MKSKTILQADQMLTTLNKQWATIQDIMLVGSLGRNKAREIKNEITKKIEMNGSSYDNLKELYYDLSLV